MMASASTFVWALIAVAHSGNISFSTGYPSEKLCIDAINVAKTGMTIAEEKADIEKTRLAKAIAEGKWRMEHPLRKPTAEDEKICSKAKDSYIIASGTGNSRCVIEDDGLVHEYKVDFLYGVSNTISVSGTNNSIKWAKCVLVNPEETK